jgi:hypothetical protein
MRISLLQQREPFGVILERTLTGFLSERFNQPHRVTWRKNVHTKNGSDQIWLCNPYLNIIFCPYIQPEPLQPAIYEFSRSARPWRTPLNKLYVALATGRISSRLFATATVKIEPPLSHAEQMVIIGGNHHIRLLDYQRKCCTVIAKHGFNKTFMLNDLAVRNEHQFLPSPRILDLSDDGSWYSEELILGTPINRLKNQRQAHQAVQQVLTSLFRLYESTRSSCPCQDYVESLVSRIALLIGRNHLLTPALRENLPSAMQRLANAAFVNTGDISTVQAHGDFQPANILEGKGGPWLIDWEYTTRRQSGYDGLVYALYSRRSAGLSQRVRGALDGRLQSDSLLAQWPEMKWSVHATRPATLALFFLEELELKLLENDNPLFTLLDAGLQTFCGELDLIIPLVERAGL